MAARPITDIEEHLRKRLATGLLAPGTMLSQASLADEYGVSRIPVRDALRSLADQGLVELVGQSAVVPSLSTDDLEELYDLRVQIEPMATSLGTRRVRRADVLRMSHLLRDMSDESMSGEEWLHTNAAFHRVVNDLCGRTRTIDLVERLRRLTDRYLYLNLGLVSNRTRMMHEHAQILEAVREGDSERAALLTADHLRNAHGAVLEHLLEVIEDERHRSTSEPRVDPPQLGRDGRARRSS